MGTKLVSRFIIGTFVTLYTLVSVISTIHVIDFFEMSNPYWLAVTLAIAFELGAAASLASLVILDKMNKTLVWALFIAITLMQMQGNMYYAFVNLEDFQSWSELFNLIEEEPLYQKRVLSFVSGAILPLVALGFIKSLVDYIKPTEDELISDDTAGFDSVANEDLDRDEDIDYFEDTFDDEDLDLEEEQDEPIEDLWDEDAELDRVLDNMVKDNEVSEDEEIKAWDGTLTDGLEDEYSAFEDSQALLEDEDGDLALERALEDKAEEEKEQFLKNKNADA